MAVRTPGKLVFRKTLERAVSTGLHAVEFGQDGFADGLEFLREPSHGAHSKSPVNSAHLDSEGMPAIGFPEPARRVALFNSGAWLQYTGVTAGTMGMKRPMAQMAGTR